MKEIEKKKKSFKNVKYFGSKKVYQHFRERVRVSEKGFCCAVTLGHQKRGNFGLF